MQEERHSRVITMIHRQESYSLLGMLSRRFITIEDSEAVLRAIRLTPPDVPIDLDPAHARRAGARERADRPGPLKHPAKVTVFVPHYAMSGGTLIALAADEIWMDDNAVLGPVDPQLGSYPAASILRVVEQKEKNKVDDETLILADIAAKAIEQVRDVVTEHPPGQDGRREGEGARAHSHLRALDPRLSSHVRNAPVLWPSGASAACPGGLRADGAVPAAGRAPPVGAVRPGALPRAGARAGAGGRRRPLIFLQG